MTGEVWVWALREDVEDGSTGLLYGGCQGTWDHEGEAARWVRVYCELSDFYPAELSPRPDGCRHGDDPTGRERECGCPDQQELEEWEARADAEEQAEFDALEAGENQ